jgi:hypothetical protein
MTPRKAETIVFDQPGDWVAVRAAESWCIDRGISVGRMQGHSPRGLLFGDYDIQKWRNLSPLDIDMLHGTMTGNMRNGPITVTIWERTNT